VQRAAKKVLAFSAVLTRKNEWRRMRSAPLVSSLCLLRNSAGTKLLAPYEEKNEQEGTEKSERSTKNLVTLGYLFA
jgi:hypothetical protein